MFQLGREKGQGAKEIGHNVACERRKSGHNLVHKRHKIGHSLECDRPSHTLTRERPKFGHNPVCERNEVWAQFCGRSMKTWDKSASIFQAFLHRLSQNKKTAITFWKKNNNNKKLIFVCLNSGGRCVNRAGRKTVRAGCSTLRNMPCWNTVDCYEWRRR